MKNLRNYEEIIRSLVERINGEDNNWTFTVKSFAKDRVRIRWSYLDYCGEKDNCFSIQLTNGDGEYTLYAYTPDNAPITAYDIVESDPKFYQYTFEQAIESAIKNIAYYAHSRY